MPPIKDNEYALVSNPIFRRLFFLVRGFGCIVALISLITELAYLTTHRFSSVTYWACYLATCVVKVLICWVICLCAMKSKVAGQKPKAFLYNIDEAKRQEMVKNFQIRGFFLHTAIPIGYYTGAFRMFNA